MPPSQPQTLRDRALSGLDAVLNSVFVARLRRRWRRWRRQLHKQRHSTGRRRIADQLRVVVVVPLIAVVAFAALAIAVTAAQASRTGHLRELTALAADTGGLEVALQDERAAAALLLISASQAQQESFSAKTRATDLAVDAYRKRRGDVTGGNATDILRRIDSGVASLEGTRRQVRTGTSASASAVAANYHTLIADLVAYRDQVVRDGAPSGLADDVRAAAALARAAEAIGEQQLTVLRGIASGTMTGALHDEIVASRTGFTDALETFSELADPQWQQWYDVANANQDVVNAQRLQDQAIRATSGPLKLKAAQWSDAMSAWMRRLSEVQQRIDAKILDRVTGVRAGQVHLVALEVIAVLLALAAAGGLAWTSARRVSLRLQELHDGVRMRHPVDLGGDDELADIALAFGALQRDAARVAADEAHMRDNMAEILVYLSERAQRLVEAVLAQVEEVERQEEDPERLERLYRLDHLATRMGRINKSLLILGGARAGRPREADVALVTVLQGAISQIEDFQRVRFGIVDNDVALVGDVVDEVAHLLAELLENATANSSGQVWIAARALGDRVIVQIGDGGSGLSPRRRARLNEVLAAPPPIDVATVRAMGLTVVGHIAARHGVRVELRPGQNTGTIAEITLPAHLFVPAVPADRAYPPAPLPAGAAQPWQANGSGPVGLLPPVDETTVLPIFAETSGWFRDVHPEATDGPIGWKTAADAGWQAAAKAASPVVTARTKNGLPVRRPRLQLVPGSAAMTIPARPDHARKRDPAAIAAAMSAYARGVAARRGTPEASQR